MRAREIVDVDVVADAGAVRRPIVGAEDRQARALPDRVLARDLDQQRRVRRGLADAAARIAAGDVEVAQDHVAHRGGGAQVAQHHLAHQFRAAVGIDRHGCGVLVGNAGFGHAVHRRGRREHEMRDAGRGAGGEQAARRAGVVAVVLERVATDSGTTVCAAKCITVSTLFSASTRSTSARSPTSPTTSGAPSTASAKTRAEIVQHDDALAAFDELPRDVAADVAGAAGDEDRAHGCAVFRRETASRVRARRVRGARSRAVGQRV